MFVGLSIAYFTMGARKVDENESEISMQILRNYADDGVQLKSLLYVTPDNEQKTDHSVPLIICSHGMNDNFWFCEDLCYTLAKRGYAVICPEHRGHKSNSAPSTFGNLEPYDIIGWLDYSEENLDYINVSNSGILGHSMGGLFAAGAYIFESLGEGRFKALVSLAGALNATRALDFFVSNPSILGQLTFTDNMTEKNPINYVTSEFPKNVLMYHGTADTIVDIRCTYDFYGELDPEGTRTDVEFHELEGAPHEIFYDSVYKKAISWFDYYILDKNTDLNSITILELDYTPKYGVLFQVYLLIACFFVMVLFGCSTYLIKPKIYQTTLPKYLTRSFDGVHESKIPRETWYHKLLLILAYLGMNGVAFLIIELFPIYSLNDMMVTAVLSTIFVVVIYHFGSPADKRNIYRWVNPKVAFVWIFGIVGSLTFYAIFPNLPIIEDNILVAGVRLTWFTPFYTTAIAVQLIANILFIRYMFFRRKSADELTYIEPILNGALLFAGTIILLSRDWPTYLIIPNYNITLYFVPMLAIGFGLGFFGFNFLARYLYKFSKTLVVGSILSGLIPAMFVGTSFITFIY
ncbi:MAG: alpha/beta fold hydrolase [Candidatus Lokiarchaeota archaeon]|nr:alpha/beta fold hydrolase [Candidatus Lokiarchaeota archaeon]